MDLGLSKLLLPVLDWINMLVGNWGVSIILLTLLMKLVLLPIDIKQRKDARKMAALQPKIDEINKRFANDAQKKSQKTMELYKAEKVNMLAGCLPMLIQFPLLIAMVTVLRNAATVQTEHLAAILRASDVEAFRQFMIDSKFLWVANIWQPDSIIMPQGAVIPAMMDTVPNYAAILQQAKTTLPMAAELTPYLTRTNGMFILAVLSGVAQFLSSKLLNSTQPQNANTNQTMKMMNYIFPIMSIYFCATYTASFALYWLFSSIFSVITNIIIAFALDKDKKLSLKALFGG